MPNRYKYCGTMLGGRNTSTCSDVACRRRQAVEKTLRLKQIRLEEAERANPGLMVHCLECGMLARRIHVAHLGAAHHMSLEEYLARHPQAPLHGKPLGVCRVCGQPVKFLNAVLCESEDCARKYHRCQGRESEHRSRLREYDDAARERVECGLCHEPFQEIAGQHLLKKHGITTEIYRQMFPQAALATSSSRQRHATARQSWMQYLGYGGKEPDDLLFEHLTGGLLGDGGLEASGNFARYCEIGKNRAYMAAKHEFYRQYFPCEEFAEIQTGMHKLTGKRYEGWPVKTAMHPLLRDWHRIWYPSGSKILAREIVESYLTPRALSIWYCDDGSASKTSNDIKIHTQAFQEDEVQFLADLLLSRFEIRATLNQDGDKWTLRLGAEARQKLLRVVGDFKWPGMEYKFVPLPKPRKVSRGATPEERKDYWKEYNRQYKREKRARQRGEPQCGSEESE